MAGTSSIRMTVASTIKSYPDSAHGILFQHHTEFAADVAGFLDE